MKIHQKSLKMKSNLKKKDFMKGNRVKKFQKNNFNLINIIKVLKKKKKMT